jgi:hypothetical protein
MAFERDSDSVGRLEVWRNTFTADGAGAFTAVEIPNTVGMLARVTWEPGGTTPDSTTTIIISDDEGVDALNGAGASQAMNAAGFVMPDDANGNAVLTPVTGPLSVALTTNSTASAVVTVAVYIIRFPR